jgi:hypothetical protein
MILYKTKYYGLLGDRVRQVIKESGRESSKFREMMTERDGKKLNNIKEILPELKAVERQVGEMIEQKNIYWVVIKLLIALIYVLKIIL